MNTNDLQYVVTMADADRILADYVNRQEPRYSGAHTLYHGTLRDFLDHVGERAERAAGS